MQPDKKLLLYFSMAYFFSWIVFVPLALNNHGFIFLFPQDAAHARMLDVWHIPTFFYRYHLSGSMLVGFILGLFAGAICMTFLYNYTQGSLLAVSCWHFTFNLVSMIGTEPVVASTMSTILMMLAVFIVIKYRMKNLSPFPKTVAGFSGPWA